MTAASQITANATTPTIKRAKFNGSIPEAARIVSAVRVGILPS
jgi:hypothetical protein